MRSRRSAVSGWREAIFVTIIKRKRANAQPREKK
jgi:hypothetical protein